MMQIPLIIWLFFMSRKQGLRVLFFNCVTFQVCVFLSYNFYLIKYFSKYFPYLRNVLLGKVKLLSNLYSLCHQVSCIHCSVSISKSRWIPSLSWVDCHWPLPTVKSDGWCILTLSWSGFSNSVQCVVADLIHHKLEIQDFKTQGLLVHWKPGIFLIIS